MTLEEIRAAAAQTAATLMAPMQPSPADFIMVAEVVEAYIGGGKQAALALCAAEPTPVEPVVVPAVSVLKQPVPEPAIQDLPLPEPKEPERHADAIPAAMGKAPSEKHEHSRHMIEKTRKARADSFMKQISVAKTKGHKQRLADEIEEAGLAQYPVTVGSENVALGVYIASLLGS